MKIGSNPTSITAATNLEIEGTGSVKTVFLQNGNVGIGTTTPNNRFVVANTSGQWDTPIWVGPSTHATSRRTGITMDDWSWMQDANGNGTKDFFLWQGSAAASRINFSTTGNVGIGAAPNAGAKLTLAAMDGAQEGAQMVWLGAGSNDAWVQDLYAGNHRFFTTSANTNQLQIFNNGAGEAGLYVEGNTGIGTGTNSDIRLFANYDTTNSSPGKHASYVNHSNNATANGTYYANGQTIVARANISSGVTNAGNIQTLSLQNLRANGTDLGTLTSMYGINLDYGNHPAGGATVVTSNAYGVVISPWGSIGTVTNMYDLFLNSTQSGGTVTNHYAVYQADTNVKSYFAGNVGIGTTAPGYKLDVNGTARVGGNSLGMTATVALGVIYTGVGTQYGIELRPTTAGVATPLYFTNSAGASQGSIGINGSGTTSYNTTSDQRLKVDTGNSAKGLAALMNLKVHNFRWKQSGAIQDGFFAQELYQVFPDAVTPGSSELDEKGNIKNPWSVDYGKVTPLLVKSVQELKGENDALKARVSKLESLLENK